MTAFQPGESDPMLPLRGFAHERVASFLRDCGEEPENTANYLANLIVLNLAADSQDLHRLGELMSEADVLLSAPNFEHERRTHKKIGDMLLFWMGVFPERTNREFPSEITNPVRIGKSSYWVVSTFDYEPYSKQAPFYQQLSEKFELYVEALRAFRRGWGAAGPNVN